MFKGGEQVQQDKELTQGHLVSHGKGRNRTRILIGLPSRPDLDSQKLRAKKELWGHLVQPLTLQVGQARPSDRRQGRPEGPERAGMEPGFPGFKIQLLPHA